MKTVFRGAGSNLTQRAKGIGDSGAARPLIQLERSPRETPRCQPPSHSRTLTSTRICVCKSILLFAMKAGKQSNDCEHDL